MVNNPNPFFIKFKYLLLKFVFINLSNYDLAVDLNLSYQELAGDLNLSYQELAGDLKLCSDDFTGAKNLYRLAGLSILKTALKLAVFGCVDQLLTYLQVNNFISRAANMQIGLINPSLPFSLFLTIQLRGRATFEKNLKFIPFLKIILYLFSYPLL